MIITNKGWFIKTLLLSSILGVGGCAVKGGSNGSSVEKWNNFSNTEVNEQVNTNKANVVFVREDADNGKALNIFVGGEYLASLLPNAYKQVEVCPANQKLVAIETDVADRYLTKENGGQIYNIPLDKTTYLRVSKDQNGQPFFLAMNEEEIQQFKQSAKEQVHTLPRVDQSLACAPATTPVVIKKFTLQAGALFNFDKADEQNMLIKGKQEIKAVADEIRNESAKISRIDVIGYTDPDGTEAYNQVLSAQRAQSVKNLMVNYGLPAESIFQEGRGKTNLLISDCAAKHSKNRTARLECNQPNRRVEIILYGTQQ